MAFDKGDARGSVPSALSLGWPLLVLGLLGVGGCSRPEPRPQEVKASTLALSAPGLIAAYSFDEAAGTVSADATGNGHSVTLTGQSWVDGKYGGALGFDGNLITSPQTENLLFGTQLTLSAWVRPTSEAAQFETVVSKETQGAAVCSLFASSETGEPGATVMTGGTEVMTRGGAPLEADAWTHLAATYDGTAIVFYVNGVQTSSTPLTGRIDFSPRPFGIGGNDVGEYFTGAIDEVRIYDRALSLGELQTDIGMPISPTGPDTTAPSVSITTPADGATLAGSVEIAADAFDNVVATDVKFFVDGTLVGNAGSAPFGVSWDSTTAAPGAHVVTAQATDAAGNTSTASPVTVTTVSNTLVAAYSFDEGTGSTLHDATGNGNDGSLSGQTWTSGRYGGALAFDGTSYVTVPDSSLLDLTSGMTISAWVKPLATHVHSPAIALKEYEGGLDYALYSQWTNESASLCIGTPGQIDDCAYGDGGVISNGEWTYLAGTYDGSIYRVYINGELAGSGPRATPAGASSLPLRIGGDSLWSFEFFTGDIDELRIYARPLSQSEIQADMGTPINPTGPDTIAPSVSITTPADGAALAGSIEIAADAFDNVLLTDVKFLVDGTLVGDDASTPFSVSWDSTTAAPGPHVLTAQATDAAGNTSTSSVTVTTVSNTLVAAYSFDEGTGSTLHDATGNGNDGSLSGQTWTSGKYGGALAFDGTSYVTVPDSSLLDLTSGMTISAWVKPLATHVNWPTIVLKEHEGGLDYNLNSEWTNKAASFCIGTTGQIDDCAYGDGG